MKDIPDKLKGSPIMTSMGLVALVATALTGIGTITGVYDSAHTSQTELDVVISTVAEYSVQSTCQSLRIQISLVEQAIWQMDQAGDNSQRLVDKRRELRDLLAQYNDLNCASVLARI